jgi:hypothetical protein
MGFWALHRKRPIAKSFTDKFYYLTTFCIDFYESYISGPACHKSFFMTAIVMAIIK